MVADPLPDLPPPSFPPGFGTRLMTPADVPLWTDVQRDAEPFFQIADDLFNQEFGHDPGQAFQRCYLITAPAPDPDHTRPGSHHAAGVISAWWDDSFTYRDQTRPFGRLHWLAVRPAYQRRGLARAASLFVLHRLRQEFGRAYLVTQSNRHGAIQLYQSLGFVVI